MICKCTARFLSRQGFVHQTWKWQEGIFKHKSINSTKINDPVSGTVNMWTFNSCRQKQGM